MKRFLLVLLLVALSGSAQAQTYYPFATDSASWSVDYMAMGQWGQTIHVPRLYYLDGDTVIGTTSYSKMCFVYDSLPYAQSSCSIPLALLRDSNKIIYCRYQFNVNGGLNTEFVLYDFNLNLGDTFKIAGGMGVDDFVVNTIDSEFTSTGYRKAWNLQKVGGWSTSLYDLRWVEGIGDIQNGVLYVEVPWVDWWCQGWCYKEWQTLIWHWINGPCFNTAISELNNAETFTLVNNPNQQFIELHFGKQAQRVIDFYDSSGKLLLTTNCSSDLLKIETSKFKKGIYLVRISENENTSSRKVIVY